MATTTRTVESLDSLRAVDVKTVEPRSLEGSVKIAQGVPDLRSVDKLIKLLRPKWRLRSSSQQNNSSPQPAARFIDELSRPPMSTVQQATTEAITGEAFTSRTPIPKPLEPNIELPAEVQSSDAAAIPDLSASTPAPQPDAQNPDGTEIKQAAPTVAHSNNTINNLDQLEKTVETPQKFINGEGNVPSAESAVAVGSITSNHAEVQRVFESEIPSIPPQPIQQSQPIQPNLQSVLPEFKFIGPNSRTGRGSLWGKVQAFRRFSENVYLATRISPGPDYVKQWQEKWEPTLQQEMYDLIIDQNDIFTFDLRMAGPSDDATSMKPTILIICNECHKSSIENKLGPLVKQTVPRDVRFQVIGKRISTASPSGKQLKEFDIKDLSVEFKASNYPLQTLMGSLARIYSHKHTWETPGVGFSTIGGLIAVGDRLYALTTAHSFFKGSSYRYRKSSDFKPCGRVASYKWLEHFSEMPFQNRVETPMDWALISIPDELAFPNHFLIDKATRVGGQVVGFSRNNEFLSEEDVWICSSSETQCGVLSSTSVSFHLEGSTFNVRTVMLEHCLEDGDSGSWVVSQTTHKLCGYVFAKVDEFELAYMLPIEPVFKDISSEFSKKTRCSVDVPDGATIRRLGDVMDKYMEDLRQTPEPPLRSPPPPPASLPNKDYTSQLTGDGLKIDQSTTSTSKATGPSSDHVQPAFSVRGKEKAIEPPSVSGPVQEMQQIGSSFGRYPPLMPYLTRPETTNQTSEFPPPGHEKALPALNRPSQEEVGPSSSSRPDNSDDLGPPQVSRNPYRASMMPIKPAPAQLPSSDHIGSLPPPSRAAPQVPQIESKFPSSWHRKPSISIRLWRWVHLNLLDWFGMFASLFLLVVIWLASFAASGYLTYFIVKKRHFSTVAKVFSILGAVSISLVTVSIYIYCMFRRTRFPLSASPYHPPP